MGLLCLYATVVCEHVKKHDKTLLHESIILFDVLFCLVVEGSGIFLTDGLSFGMKDMLNSKA